MSSLGTGYNVAQVDEYFEKSKKDWSNISSLLSERSVRFASFDTQKGGYSIREVDAALHRLEKALSKRNKDILVAKIGEEKWLETINERVSKILEISQNPKKERFKHPRDGQIGYRVTEVDRFLDRIFLQFDRGERRYDSVAIRAKVFSSAKGNKAYKTLEVDLFLDDIVSIFNAFEV